MDEKKQHQINSDSIYFKVSIKKNSHPEGFPISKDDEIKILTG